MCSSDLDVAAMAKALEPLEAAANATAARVAELTAQVEAARAEVARWQAEQAFMGRYAELQAVITAREATARDADTKVAEAREKLAADGQAKGAVEATKAARVQAVAEATAALEAEKARHADLVAKIAARREELVASEAALAALVKASGMLEQATVQAKAALDVTPADAELAAAHKLLVDTLAAKAAQMKGMREAMEGMAAEKAAWETATVESIAAAEKRQAEMPALVAAVAELDGPIADAAKVVEATAAALAAVENEATARQAEVDEAVRQLLAFQGVVAPPPAP